MAHGFTGKILHVDLTDGRHWVEEPDDAFYRKMMGGRALVAHYLLTLVRRAPTRRSREHLRDGAGHRDRLDVLRAGPQRRRRQEPAHRRSRQRRGRRLRWRRAEAGRLRRPGGARQGCEARRTSGSRTAPSRSATPRTSGAWTIADAQAKIREEVGDKGARTTLIGPGGENLVRFACVVNDLSHFAGRTGVGAVMGSKNLKGLRSRRRAPLPGQRQEAEPGPRQVDDREPGPDLALPRCRDGRRPAGAEHGRRPARPSTSRKAPSRATRRSPAPPCATRS